MSEVVTRPAANGTDHQTVCGTDDEPTARACVKCGEAKPLNEFAADALFKPLGMKDTTYLPPASWLPRIAPTQRVKDAKTGEVTNWGAEMGPPHGLQRGGWRRDTMKIGEEVTVVGSMAKNGTKRMNASTVKMTATGGRPGQVLDAVSSGSPANNP